MAALPQTRGEAHIPAIGTECRQSGDGGLAAGYQNKDGRSRAGRGGKRVEIGHVFGPQTLGLGKPAGHAKRESAGMRFDDRDAL
ncbi:hypothetical protein [Roseovarius sp.]|uniref:hypothetical protein n=1 Tax=Roseovarius sp. TaxID=1486281 RepID=UPI003D09A16B